MTNPLEIRHLAKRYRDKAALSDVCLDCPPGSIVGLLGPNGSGKSTLLKSIAGLCVPSSGSVLTLGVDALELESKQLSQIGFVQQEMDLLEWLSVRDHLDYIASYYQDWDRGRQTQLVEEFEIDPKAKVAALSAGDRQKLAIILAVCHHPKLLLLDEPASALDPDSRSRMLKFLLEIARDETAVIISSHILVDVEKIIDHVWFLKSGQLIADQSLDELLESYADWTVSAEPGRSLPERFEEPFILRQRGDEFQKALVVRDPQRHHHAFEREHSLSVREANLNLEAIYPLLSQSAEASNEHSYERA